MTIKSDNWIRRQCTMPKFVAADQYKGILPYFTHADPAELEAAGHTPLAGIRPDTTAPYYPYYRPLMLEEQVMWRPMIEPFEPSLVRQRQLESLWSYPDGPNGEAVEEERFEKLVSYGTSSYGYDIRAAREFKVFTNINSTIVDPKNFDHSSFVEVVGDHCIIPPNSFALARTVEYFRIPRNVLAICLGKSTYARCGIVVNVTPLEPEWEGYLTLEFSNTTPLPAKIYAGEGCAQLLFFESDEQCGTTYADRQGKYQGQAAEPIPPKV